MSRSRCRITSAGQCAGTRVTWRRDGLPLAEKRLASPALIQVPRACGPTAGSCLQERAPRPSGLREKDRTSYEHHDHGDGRTDAQAGGLHVSDDVGRVCIRDIAFCMRLRLARSAWRHARGRPDGPRNLGLDGDVARSGWSGRRPAGAVRRAASAPGPSARLGSEHREQDRKLDGDAAEAASSAGSSGVHAAESTTGCAAVRVRRASSRKPFRIWSDSLHMALITRCDTARGSRPGVAQRPTSPLEGRRLSWSRTWTGREDWVRGSRPAAVSSARFLSQGWSTGSAIAAPWTALAAGR